MQRVSQMSDKVNRLFPLSQGNRLRNKITAGRNQIGFPRSDGIRAVIGDGSCPEADARTHGHRPLQQYVPLLHGGPGAAATALPCRPSLPGDSSAQSPAITQHPPDVFNPVSSQRRCPAVFHCPTTSIPMNKPVCSFSPKQKTAGQSPRLKEKAGYSALRSKPKYLSAFS